MTYSYLLPIVVSLVFFKKANPKKVLVIVGVYCSVFFVLNVFFKVLQRDWTRSVYYFTYTLLEYSTFVALLFINIRDKRAKFFGLCISILFAVFLYLFNFVIKFIKFDSIPIAAETLVLLVFIIYFFYEQFRDPSSLYIYNHYCFWFAIGILIYLCGSLFIYVYGDQMTLEQILRFWFFTYVVEIIKNILFTVAIVIYCRNFTFKHQKKHIPFLDIQEL
jgi:hypothetical protein